MCCDPPAERIDGSFELLIPVHCASPISPHDCERRVCPHDVLPPLEMGEEGIETLGQLGERY